MADFMPIRHPLFLCEIQQDNILKGPNSHGGDYIPKVQCYKIRGLGKRLIDIIQA